MHLTHINSPVNNLWWVNLKVDTNLNTGFVSNNHATTLIITSYLYYTTYYPSPIQNLIQPSEPFCKNLDQMLDKSICKQNLLPELLHDDMYQLSADRPRLVHGAQICSGHTVIHNSVSVNKHFTIVITAIAAAKMHLIITIMMEKQRVLTLDFIFNIILSLWC